MNILLVGLPGSGKGTQGVRLSAALSLSHVDAGAEVRRHVAERTPLGRLAAPHVERRELLPDELMKDIIESSLHRADERGGFVLDGFPRKPAARLWLSQQPFAPDVVLHLSVPEEVVTGRLALRVRGTEDTGTGLRKRLDDFSRFTAEVLRSYAAEGLVRTVDGVGSLDTVTLRLLDALPERPLRS